MICIDRCNLQEDSFEKYPGEPLAKICPKLDELGLDLLNVISLFLKFKSYKYYFRKC